MSRREERRGVRLSGLCGRCCGIDWCLGIGNTPRNQQGSVDGHERKTVDGFLGATELVAACDHPRLLVARRYGGGEFRRDET